MSIHWLTAYIDLPASGYNEAATFWAAVTGTTCGPSRGDNGEFCTLEPANGDAYIRVQRTAANTPGVHLDLHVDDIALDTQRAVDAGATLVSRSDFSSLTSPAGLRFCLVPHSGESVAPNATLLGGHPTRLAQVSIDVPAPLFEAETRFWGTLLGTPTRPAGRDEYVDIVGPDHWPLSLLLQRLGPDDGADSARAHLDVSGGEHQAELAAEHVRLGATLVGPLHSWTVMKDPLGTGYCLIRR